MKFLIVILGFMVYCGCTLAQHTLEVTVSDIKVIKGSIRMALYNNSADFMKKHKAVREVAVTGNNMHVTFDNLEPGEYAISCYHDINNNKKLDSNFMGIPREPYGFSNNARGTFGPPAFEDARFTVKSNTKQSISLK
ncbi:MAG: DUF2141 domain-containing protein [Flammeovirgaceae bacterium]|nr:MAG: DUF2141 domain-containing protein [Flammeovirgaceae bacterium]